MTAIEDLEKRFQQHIEEANHTHQTLLEIYRDTKTDVAAIRQEISQLHTDITNSLNAKASDNSRVKVAFIGMFSGVVSAVFTVLITTGKLF